MILRLLNSFFSDFPNWRKKEVDKKVDVKPTDEKQKVGKYDDDVKGLFSVYGDCAVIDTTLQNLLKIAPRKRARIEAYNGLKSFLKKKYNIELHITSRKTKNSTLNNEKCEQG